MPRQDGPRGRDLSEAEALEHGNSDCLDCPDERHRYRGATRARHPPTRQIGAGEAWVAHQLLEDGGDGEERGDPFLLEEIEEAIGVDRRFEHEAGPGPIREEEHGETAGEGQRERKHDPVVRGEFDRLRPSLRSHVPRSVRENRAFRIARRPGGVAEERRSRLVRQRRRNITAGIDAHRRNVVGRQHGHRRIDHGARRRQGFVGHEDSCAGVAHHEGDLRRGEADVEGNDHRGNLPRGDRDFDPLGPVEHQDGDPISGADPTPAEIGGDR